MNRGLWLCGGCRLQAPLTSGTTFQDRKLPRTTWFRALWEVTRQKKRGKRLGSAVLTRLGGFHNCHHVGAYNKKLRIRPNSTFTRCDFCWSPVIFSDFYGVDP